MMYITPFPIHGLDKAMGLRDTSLHTAGFIYAITGTLQHWDLFPGHLHMTGL